MRRTRAGSGGAHAGSMANRMSAARMRGSMSSGSSFPPTNAMEQEDDNDVPPEVRFCRSDLFFKYDLFCSDR